MSAMQDRARAFLPSLDDSNTISSLKNEEAATIIRGLLGELYVKTTPSLSGTGHFVINAGGRRIDFYGTREGAEDEVKFQEAVHAVVFIEGDK